MGGSPFAPDTWAKLWALKTGRALKEPATPAMRRGLHLEKNALACYVAMTGRTVQPQVLVKGAYSAGLDGLSEDGPIDLEIKCPWRGRDSHLWQEAGAGRVPPHSYWQLQHPLYVSDPASAHFFVYDGARQGLLLEVMPDLEDIACLRTQWDRFWDYIGQDIDPPWPARIGSPLVSASGMPPPPNFSTTPSHVKARRSPLPDVGPGGLWPPGAPAVRLFLS